MSLIGHVFNRSLQRNIPVYLSETDPGFTRLTTVIDQNVKFAALALLKERFESGSLFNESDMRLMERVTITNLFHGSPGDPNEHLSVQGEYNNGNMVKGGHASVDASKQTIRVSPTHTLPLTNHRNIKHLLTDAYSCYLAS
ncbi:hypothetical protein BO79DRAFT_158484 [Aspergillus costaricaensis CBS 115574]|uniref:Uncharacterized protein n=1 Tax=Aspergillus costaricaensis CBS 115574 TaxID=1448317 RepID=A0ACD1I242_9EURO|nr:hypothetical protein BO79DRAFT_158484 [Aspergillus costaricaensis CBS 115574]RAK84362.1 hypothetical protein BO79DRAFT_158484 [Aspergillus costaricaensis CBS 115574]